MNGETRAVIAKVEEDLKALARHIGNVSSLIQRHGIHLTDDGHAQVRTLDEWRATLFKNTDLLAALHASLPQDESPVVTCRFCRGQGHFHGDSTRELCPACSGTGTTAALHASGEQENEEK